MNNRQLYLKMNHLKPGIKKIRSYLLSLFAKGRDILLFHNHFILIASHQYTN
jgi:hypothetical protein